jgi:hypothetical protein
VNLLGVVDWRLRAACDGFRYQLKVNCFRTVTAFNGLHVDALGVDDTLFCALSTLSRAHHFGSFCLRHD